MSTPWNQVLAFYRDASGREATTSWSLADQSSAVPAALSNLASALQGVSRAHLYAVQLQTTLHIPGTASTDDYKTVQDVVHVLGRYGGLSPRPAHYDLIAPKDTILLADQTTLDMSNPLVIAVRDAMVGVIGTPAGVALASLTRGSRQWAGRR